MFVVPNMILFLAVQYSRTEARKNGEIRRRSHQKGRTYIFK